MGDLAIFPDTDEVRDRPKFVQEYNRLAKKHGIRVLVTEDFKRDPKNAGGGLGCFVQLLQDSNPIHKALQGLSGTGEASVISPYIWSILENQNPYRSICKQWFA
ncbi:putative RhoGAP domain-containing protein [Colletotrichum tabaci]|uniref:RhoGAP domain-containing protein n=1 Tax=Colletotrichum tabaci TaxID=1209068 RepID=A0AAV9T4D9_9PEZI